MCRFHHSTPMTDQAVFILKEGVSSNQRKSFQRAKWEWEKASNRRYRLLLRSSSYMNKSLHVMAEHGYDL